MANISFHVRAYTYTPHNTFNSISFDLGCLHDLDAFTDRLGSIPLFLPIFHRQSECTMRHSQKQWKNGNQWYEREKKVSLISRWETMGLSKIVDIMRTHIVHAIWIVFVDIKYLVGCSSISLALIAACHQMNGLENRVKRQCLWSIKTHLDYIL